MPQDIEITVDQIRLAEQILLPNGKTFDDERRKFIEDLGTFDLHAAPGSGKTTALLAKLLALEQHLPFENGSGILVLSHTNAAVDEIKEKVGYFCPRLMSYPNFVGTIQSFTDYFLTIPYYKALYKKRPVRIDDDIYKEHHYVDARLSSYLDRRNDKVKILYDYRLRLGDNLSFKRSEEPFPFSKTSTTFQKILALKKKIREDGFLSYDDAYILAMEYMQKYPRIVEIVNQRFRYVFVDEMQDMDLYQYSLLETLFAGAVHVGYQRIGDKNQSIYNSDESMDAVWLERNKKEFNGSHRLQPLVSSIVEPLALSPIAIKGQNTNPDGSPIAIQPIMFVYDDNTIKEVIPRFARTIKTLTDSGKINLKTDYKFRAIGWTTGSNNDNNGAIRLNQYYPEFSKDQQSLKINYPCLESYLHYYTPGVNKLASIRKSVLNALLRALRIEGISDPVTGRAFTKRSLLDFLRNNHADAEPKFKLYLYLCAKSVAEGDIPLGLRRVTILIQATLNKFGAKITGCKDFVKGKHSEQKPQESESSTGIANQYTNNGITVEIGTVHSVKGQTHTCTLYLETFYQRNIGGMGNYESTRISSEILGNAPDSNAHRYVKQSLKMAYVGFSRPTHLLAFAVHKRNYKSKLEGKMGIEKWEVRIVQTLNKADTGY